MRIAGKAALNTEGDRALAVAAVGHHRSLVLGEDAALDHPAAASVLTGAAGVAQNVVSGHYRGQPLLSFQWLDHQPDAEDRRRRRAPILAVAAAQPPTIQSYHMNWRS